MNNLLWLEKCSDLPKQSISQEEEGKGMFICLVCGGESIKT
jgi:hypothetical protein